MPKIERFEDIQAWQKARELNNGIYKATKKVPFAKDFSLQDQIRRAHDHFKVLYKETEEVSKMIQGFMNYLNS